MTDLLANACPRCNSPRDEHYSRHEMWEWNCLNDECGLRARADINPSKERNGSRVVFNIDTSEITLDLHIGKPFGVIVVWYMDEGITTISRYDNLTNGRCVEVKSILPFTITRDELEQYLLLA